MCARCYARVGHVAMQSVKLASRRVQARRQVSDSYLKVKVKVNEKKSEGERKWMGMGRKQPNLDIPSPSPVGVRTWEL